MISRRITFRSLKVGAWLLIGCAAWGAVARAQPEAAPLGAVLVEVEDPTDEEAVARQVQRHFQVTRSRADSFEAWFERMKQLGVFRRDAWRPCFPATILLRSQGQLVLPHRARGTQFGAESNELTFVYQGWSEAQETELRAFVDKVYPILKDLCGPPALPNEVKIIHDATLRVLESATYNVSTKEIKLKLLRDGTTQYPDPQTAPFDDWDFFVVTLMLARAFHDEALFSFDAWEEGFARAVQLAAIVRAWPTFEIFRDPFHILPSYEALNQPALGNDTFNAHDTTDFLMLQIRVGMAQAAWFKVYIENNNFFREFNRRYYAKLNQRPGLAADVARLKNLGAEVVPTVEGLGFLDWFRRQHVLDTEVTVGPKLFVFNKPAEDYEERFDQFVNSLILLIYHYLTTAEGKEEPLSGTVHLKYLAYDGFDITGSAIGGTSGTADQVELNTWGDQPGLGSLVVLFFNIGGPQRITVEVTVNGLQQQIYYPFDVVLDNAKEPFDIFGVVTQGLQRSDEEGTLRLMLPDKPPIEVTGPPPDEPGSNKPGQRNGPHQGVFAAKVPGGLILPGQATFEYTAPNGQQFTFRRNVGFGNYLALLPTVEKYDTFTHEYPAGLNLIGLPAYPSLSDDARVFRVEAGRLRLARYRPEETGDFKYRFYPDTPPLAPGLGYWLYAAEPLSLEFVGERASTDDDFPLSLGRGWQQVANPFADFAIDVAEIKVQFQTSDRMTLPEAQQRGWISQGVWGYSARDGSYVMTTRFEPWNGYWLQVLAERGVTLYFPPRAAPSAARARAAPPEGPGWRVPLVARAGPVADLDNYFGVAPGAAEGFSPQADAPQPPDFGDYVSLSFPHPEWGRHAGDYAIDLREPGSGKQVWNVEVRTNLPQTDVVLTWPDLRSVPPDLRLTLVDPETATRQSLRTTARYRFRSGPTGARRQLQIIAEPQGGKVLTVSNLVIRPTRGGQAVSCTLSAPATLSAAVYSLSGRCLRQVLSGRAAEAGLHTHVWEETDEAGRPLPNGVYLYEVRAVDDEGQPARAVRPVRVQR